MSVEWLKSIDERKGWSITNQETVQNNQSVCSICFGAWDGETEPMSYPSLALADVIFININETTRIYRAASPHSVGHSEPPTYGPIV